MNVYEKSLEQGGASAIKDQTLRHFGIVVVDFSDQKFSVIMECLAPLLAPQRRSVIGGLP